MLCALDCPEGNEIINTAILATLMLLGVMPMHYCDSRSLSCSSINDVLQTSSNGKHFCCGDEISCSSLNDIFQVSSNFNYI